MAFAQLTYRESLRDIEACLGAMQGKLYHIGFRGKVAPSTAATVTSRRVRAHYNWNDSQHLSGCRGVGRQVGPRPTARWKSMKRKILTQPT
jgi:hypothetical protein